MALSRINVHPLRGVSAPQEVFALWPASPLPIDAGTWLLEYIPLTRS
jgi:hypothetical protein